MSFDDARILRRTGTDSLKWVRLLIVRIVRQTTRKRASSAADLRVLLRPPMLPPRRSPRERPMATPKPNHYELVMSTAKDVLPSPLLGVRTAT